MTANPDNRIQKVVILGGGTAGWMTAAYLGKALQGTVGITVLEAPTIPRIGVGEATVPNLQRSFFDFLGISEDDWMRECNASFKMAVRFVNWRTEGPAQATARELRNGGPDHFYHPFGLLPDYGQTPLSHFWFKRKYEGRTTEPFDYACFREPPVMDALKAPRWLDGRPATRYAWHFDAQLVADFLRRFATEKQGVHHVQDAMVRVEQDDHGYVTALRTKGGLTLEADLFVDCSGFRGLLINQALEEPFIDMGDHLLCDSAVATAVPHDDKRYGIEPYTSAIAMSSGWTWKIPMLGRFGTGYVYSSKFTDQESATQEFCNLWDLDPEQAKFNHIRFRVGRNRRAWVKNVVGIGLSSCFLEPLESTGIYFITAAIYQLAKHFPDRNFSQGLIDSFNHEIELMFDDTRDFIQAHFYYAPRNDTPFWQANKNLRLPENIQKKISAYRAGLPINSPITDESTYYGNFEAEFRNFWTNGSYYCIFSGLGLHPDAPLPALAHQPESVAGAEPLFETVKRQQQNLLETLPSAYDYLRQLHGA
ncbi:Flavin-dependent tryptophan halogenase RebH [Frankia canadensis]|uniref:Flavin-dependent tryptophan halogenase RebH n=1 Tax=Frankia canadensis TaxID=1836972 RepID=A0A2I2L273_9ACTN|nr:tryptophan halogenase family protein [Frankia canadensis]SNQ52009.1 Flavin-dependent tryptophan halogenase RebH [Frankia canadensis]SOU59299.1 Flavin-dependent tryptophan halogenase RebH [Frankia canadensis]